MNLLFKDYFQANLQWTMLQSAMVTGAIVMVISVVALIFTEETFHKDLDFIEE